jgi:hypothetical protein
MYYTNIFAEAKWKDASVTGTAAVDTKGSILKG